MSLHQLTTLQHESQCLLFPLSLLRLAFMVSCRLNLRRYSSLPRGYTWHWQSRQRFPLSSLEVTRLRWHCGYTVYTVVITYECYMHRTIVVYVPSEFTVEVTYVRVNTRKKQKMSCTTFSVKLIYGKVHLLQRVLQNNTIS